MPPRTKTGARRTGLSGLTKTSSVKVFADLIRQYPNRQSVIAEGDSWFAYPKKNLVTGKPSNVIDHLSRMRRFNLLNRASNGDEAVDMLSGASKHQLIGLLERFQPDFLLFSGGGNDVVGENDFDFFLRASPSAEPGFRGWLRLERLERRVQSIRNAYLDLCDYALAISPGTRVISHTYDNAVPDKQGAVFLGGLVQIDKGRSWMYPYLVRRGVPERFHKPIARHLINTLATNLLAVEASKANFTVVDTRGTANDADWLNEIHLDTGGFKKVAEKVLAAMAL